jgi:hypothetical protein
VAELLASAASQPTAPATTTPAVSHGPESRQQTIAFQAVTKPKDTRIFAGEIELIDEVGGDGGFILGDYGDHVAIGQEAHRLLRARIRRHEYPGTEFVDLAGILMGSILLLTPGFITDFVGFLLMIPFFRRFLGRAVTRRMDRSLHEVYEYLQLSDLA